MRISDWSSDVCSSDLAQLGPWQDYMSLWQATTSRMLGGKPEPVAAPERSDRRFKDEAWESSYLFDYIKQTYLLTARWMQKTVHQVEGLDDKTRRKVDFYTRDRKSTRLNSSH